MSKIVKLPDMGWWSYIREAENLLSEGGDKAEAVRLYSEALEKFDDTVSPGLIGKSVATKLGDLVWAREILEKWYAERTEFDFFDMPIADVFAIQLNDMKKARAIYENFTKSMVDPCFFVRTAGGFARVLKDENRAKELYFEALLRGQKDRGKRGVFDVIFKSLADDLADKDWARSAVKGWVVCVARRDDINTVLEAVDKLNFNSEDKKVIYRILIRRAKKFPFCNALEIIQKKLAEEKKIVSDIIKIV